MKTRRPRGNFNWVSPFHWKDALGMERDRKGNLIVDPRPNCMRPERPKIDMSLGFATPLKS